MNEKIIEALKEHEYKRVFPLQTQMSMAERWGVARQVVANWAQRHDDFPKEIEGLIVKTAKTPKVYAYEDVLKYEHNRGLTHGRGDG
ncbi:hypothetical protein NYE67_20700 [Solibacillus sp. FSL W8-0474]|uniref:hypothetical protein n=1 Tax=Solibacillus sp. FSL W8-0474 TaxID=2975336 RepID=UPI0030F62FE1